MKTRNWITLIGLAIAVTLLAGPAFAQTVNLTANVPFEFTANNVALNPGVCTVRSVANNTILLTDAKKKHVATIMTVDDLRDADDAKMIFHRYGDHYFLVQIETPSAAYNLPVSNREKEMARASSPREAVTVLARAATRRR